MTKERAEIYIKGLEYLGRNNLTELEVYRELSKLCPQTMVFGNTWSEGIERMLNHLERRGNARGRRSYEFL